MAVVRGLWIDRRGQSADAPDPVDQSEQVAAYLRFAEEMRMAGEAEKRARTWTKDSVAVVVDPIPFDPNSADSMTLRRVGMPAWMVGNLLKYRRAGGRFRRPEDIAKLYGMDSTLMAALLPYAYIARENEPDAETTSVWLPRDTFERAEQQPPKFEPGTIVELNRTDTTELKRIPGVGSAAAAAIISYRDRLGGYHHIGQLYEIRIDTARLAPWVHIDTTLIQPLRVNQAGLQRLQRHPYINFYQARAFIEERRREGRLTSLSRFSLMDEFTTEDIARMAPYISFD